MLGQGLLPFCPSGLIMLFTPVTIRRSRISLLHTSLIYGQYQRRWLIGQVSLGQVCGFLCPSQCPPGECLVAYLLAHISVLLLQVLMFHSHMDWQPLPGSRSRVNSLSLALTISCTFWWLVMVSGASLHHLYLSWIPSRIL